MEIVGPRPLHAISSLPSQAAGASDHTKDTDRYPDKCRWNGHACYSIAGAFHVNAEKKRDTQEESH